MTIHLLLVALTAAFVVPRPLGAATAPADGEAKPCCSHEGESSEAPDPQKTPADRQNCDGCGIVCCVKLIPLSDQPPRVAAVQASHAAAIDVLCLFAQEPASSLLRPPRI